MSVQFKLYASNGTTPVYTFPCVFEANFPHTEKRIIEHTSVRSSGSIIIDGGEVPWTLTLKGVIMASDYDALVTIIDAIESAVVTNTPYYIKIISTGKTYSYKCKRIEPIEWDSSSLKNRHTEYVINLRCNSW